MTIEQWGRAWSEAEGRERGRVIAQMMQALGYSRQTCYRKLEAEGFRSGKKRRSDAGQSSVCEDDLRTLAAMLREGLRDNGKEQLKIPEARSIMAMNGFSIQVSNRQLARLLEREGLSMKSLKQRKPHQSLRSLHPNHVGQVDPSYCTMYYLPQKNGRGKQVIIEDRELYKNKHELYEKLAKAKLKIWRYVYVDHYSGCIFAHYFHARGENQENLYEFLLHAWGKRPGDPLHGVPKILMLDKGSANTAKAMIAALSALGVEVLPHAAGNSRAKGAVEKANDIVETTFEARLRFEPLHSIEELNASVHAYFVAFNANAVPQRESRIQRPGGVFVREQLWLQIKEEQLRILPDMALCRRLLLEPAAERSVSAERTISYMQHTFAPQGGIYSVAHLEINVGDKVAVQALAYEGAAILLSYQDYSGQQQQARIAEPLPLDGAGRIAGAAIIGQQHKAAADDAHEQQRKNLENLAHPKELGGKKKNATPFAHLHGGKGLQSHEGIAQAVEEHRSKNLTIPKAGQQIGALGAVQIYEVEYNLMEALTWLKAKLEANGQEYRKEYVGLVKSYMKEGKITERELLNILENQTEDQNEEFQKQA